MQVSLYAEVQSKQPLWVTIAYARSCGFSLDKSRKDAKVAEVLYVAHGYCATAGCYREISHYLVRSVHIRLVSTHEPAVKKHSKTRKVGHVWAGLGSQVDEDSVCRCEIVGFGEIRASTIGASEHDEWYNVSINYKDGEGLFYTLFTYKEPPSSFLRVILEMHVLTN